MPSINFSQFTIKDGKVHKGFVEGGNFYDMPAKVESGEKYQTIRMGRRIKTRDKLYFFTGLRTPKCERLQTPFTWNNYVDEKEGVVLCTEIIPIEMRWNEKYNELDIRNIRLELTYLEEAMKKLAVKDGFKTLGDMEVFFRETYLQLRKGWHEGQIIRWR